MPELVVASFNVHAGIDGWGRPYDVTAACAALEADVLFLEENWFPEDGPSLAGEVAKALGYEVHEAVLCDAMRFDPVAHPGRHWGPSRGEQRKGRPLWVTDAATLERVRRCRPEAAERGSWGMAMLSRLAVKHVETLELGRLARDGSRLRAALFADIALDGSTITAVGTHLAHFPHGSPVLLRRLRRALPAPSEPGLLVGDMNFWGPPVSAVLPGWRRAVRSRSYPSWRPHSQIDHIFVTRAVRVVSSETLRVGMSDHLPVRARLAIS